MAKKGPFLRDHQERLQQITDVLVVIMGFVFMGALRQLFQVSIWIQENLDLEFWSQI